MPNSQTIFSLLAAEQAGAGGLPLGPSADPRARQQAALLALGRRVSARPALHILLQDAVSLVTEILQADLGGISRVLGGGAVEVRLATIDREGHSIAVAESRTTLDSAISIVAYAMKTASPVLSVELAGEKRFTDLFLREHKIVTGLVVPLPVDERPFGTIGVFCRQKRDYSLDEVRFAETIAHLISTSVGRARAEEELRKGRNLTDAVLDSVAEIVFTLDLQGLVIGANRAARDKTGYSAEEVRRRPFVSVFVAPQDLAAFQSALEAAKIRPSQFSGQVVAKDSRRLPIEWLLQPITADGQTSCFLLTGRLPSASEGPMPFAPSGALPEGRDLRSSPRRTFQYRQLIAPMYTATLPHKHEFFEVECKDISAGGVSFYLDHPPDFNTLVVVLGRAPGLSYFTARVARVAEERREERVHYVVGCRFIGRVHL